MKLSPPRPIRWTRDEYVRLAELGAFDGRRVERIRGEVIEMAPQDSPHATSAGLVDDALRRVFRHGHTVRAQQPLALGADSDPEPDVAVVAGTRRDFAPSHPTSALLVVEVADSSLAYDRDTKDGLYAEAGIEEYWIVNLVDGVLEVRRRPQAVAESPGRFRCADRRVLRPGDAIAPLAAPDAAVQVADLLP